MAKKSKKKKSKNRKGFLDKLLRRDVVLPDIRLIISQLAYQKMRYFTRECPVEISGFGKVEEAKSVDGMTTYRISDIEILPQKANDIHVDLDMEGMAKWLTEKMRKGEGTEEYRFWWHSHNDFPAFFSGPDLQSIDRDFPNYPFLISLVMNKMGDMTARYDEYEPRSHNIVKHIVIEETLDKNILNKVRRAIKKNVTVVEKMPISSSPIKAKYTNRVQDDIPFVDPDEVLDEEFVDLGRLDPDEVGTRWLTSECVMEDHQLCRLTLVGGRKCSCDCHELVGQA